MKRSAILLFAVLLLLSSCARTENIEIQTDIMTTDSVGSTEIEDDNKKEDKTEMPNQNSSNENTNDTPVYKEPLNLFLSPLFKSNMVIQRDQKIKVFGTGAGDGKITLGTVTKEFTAVNNKWEVEFDAMTYSSAPITFELIEDERRKVLTNVVVGDVYIASGQSNMDLKLSETEQRQSGAVASKLLRFKNRDNNNWQEFTEYNTQGLSAIGTLFALNLEKALEQDIPIGIIPAAIGASRVEEWTSREYAEREPYLTYTKKPHYDYDNFTSTRPSLHYGWEHYIEPITSLSVAGVLWYQGESNRGVYEAPYYYELFENMVNCWRDAFNREDLPFYTVQIMMYSNDTAKDGNGNAVDEYNVRIGQWKAAMNIPNVTLCTYLSFVDTLDEDDNMNIHPTDKQPVADALANAVLTRYYYEKGEYDKAVEYSGPLCSGVAVQGNVATVSFEHVGDGLKLSRGSGKVTEMEIRLSDGSWVKAENAVISGDTVIITADTGTVITGVRMSYRNQPTMQNLCNSKDGKTLYCASPFIWLID